MARYAVTILAIAAIILATADNGNAALPEEPIEFTILSYNTHLFEDSIFECICRCGEIPNPDKCTWADHNYEDLARRYEIVSKIEASGADVIALQEVWAPCWQQWFIDQLAPTYVYSATWDSSCVCWDVLGLELQACLGFPMGMISDHCCGDGCCAETYTLGNALVLLSKWPLSDIGFERFPTFTQCSIGECEVWADKGVLTATVDVNGVQIRIGISHALTGPDDEKSKWDTSYIPTAITPFYLNGEAYIFALASDNTGHIVRMEDYGSSWDQKAQKYNYGAGWKHIYAGPWGSNYNIVTSFEMDGHPYLFALINDANHASLFRINNDPSTGWTNIYEGAWDVNIPNPGYADLNAWYRFENNTLDGSGNSRDGNPIGDPAYSPYSPEGKYSIELDGDNDCVVVGPVGIDGNSPRTIAGWVKATKPPDQMTDWRNVFGFTSGGGANTHFDIQRRNVGDYYCIHVWDWVENIAELDQDWHHLAATYDGKTIAWYAEGNLVGSADIVLNTIDNVQIGKRADYPLYFPGLVDDVRIYSRALSQDEIGQLADWGHIEVLSFEMNGHPYLFMPCNTDNRAYIFRINDDPCTGWTNIYKGPMISDYVAVDSFELEGHSYLFALDNVDHADILRLNDDPCTGWEHIYKGSMSSNYVAINSFELGGHPYMFLRNKTSHQVYIVRINDDPSTGWKILSDLRDLTAWYQFENNTLDSSGNSRDGNSIGAPTYNTDSREGKYSIELDGDSDCVVVGPVGIDGNSPRTIAGWVKATKPPDQMTDWRNVFGFTSGGGANTHFDIQRRNDQDYYCIHVWGWVENIAPLDQEWHHLAATYDGKTIAWYAEGNLVGSADIVLNTIDNVQIGKRADYPLYFPGLLDDVRIYNRALSQGEVAELAGLDYISVKSFEMNGHPYLFALRNCCDQYMDSTLCRPRPGEAYLKRINDDPNTGWENVYQLEDIKIIRDETVADEDGPPAIMMGDLNIHRGKYGIMDELFSKAGAVDAYIEVHGTGAGGETINYQENTLMQYFHPDIDPTDTDLWDRIDYVYVKQSGSGLRLVPTEAHVFRDWKYYSPTAGDDWDLSDHYPLAVKFKIFQGGCTARARGDLNCDRLINFADLAILSSAWMSGPNDISWDPACDISEPADDFIDTKDVDVFASAWLTMPVHNVTQKTWYKFIQAAIDDANDDDEIQVAPGTYYEAIDFKGKAIMLYSSGGPEVTTIDANGIAWAYHVVQCVNGEDANTILEGFTITGGKANGSFPDNCGGGMINKNSNPTVINCTFSGNIAAADGGGMFNYDYSSPTVTNCIFSNNSANWGGGMRNHYSSPALTGCDFNSNSANLNGGGIFNSDSNPTVINCIFSGNYAANDGGGMNNYSNSSPTVTDCSFSSNSAAIHGGGMCNVTSCNPTLTNCTFSQNAAENYGGGIINSVNCSPAITGCVFSSNMAGHGGGMYNYDNSAPTVTNCTFTGNTATNDGGGMYNYYNSNPAVTNCILWADTPDEIYDNSSTPIVTYCDVQGGWIGEGNINDDPCFVDVDTNDLRLLHTSSCIDAGNTAALPPDTADLDDDGDTAEPVPFDRDGNNRVWNGIVDMGAYEYLTPPPPISSADNFEYLAMICADWLVGTKPEF